MLLGSLICLPLDFYPRSPCGERRPPRVAALLRFIISIHALLAESDDRRASRQQPAGISIHALLAESDTEQKNLRCRYQPISIHALLAESDRNTKNNYTDYCDFYPRSPCGERQPSSTRRLTNMIISIHALLAESDTASGFFIGSRSQFLSTLSLRRATLAVQLGCRSFRFLSTLSLRRATIRSSCKGISYCLFLSTLSLRRATSLSISKTVRRICHFYPRSPCGERRQ